jgi:hypothetical protein
MKRILIVLIASFVSSLTIAQQTPGFQPIKPNVIDVNRAFISPFEFTQAFGGTFEPRAFQTLFWEFNGVQLLMKKGSTTVSSVLEQKDFNLVRPVQEKDNRTVVEATILFKFNCTISPTSASDLQVGVTCGAGQTLQTQFLRRY